MPEKQTLEDFIQTKLENPTKGTEFGFHWISDFLNNPWHWYLRHYLGIDLIYQKPSLIFGSAFHAAKEAFYKTEASERSLSLTFTEILRSKKAKYFDQSKYQEDLTRGPKMLFEWARKYGESDLENNDLLFCEETLSFPLVNEFPMTVQFDAVFRDKQTRQPKIHETKTTSFSKDIMFNSINSDNQATTYLLAWNTLFPKDPCYVVVPDVTYQKGITITPERKAEITRTKYQLSTWHLSLLGTFQRLYLSLKAVQTSPKNPIEYYFPRNGAAIAAFSGENYYEAVEKTRPDLKFLPEGFFHTYEEAQARIAKFITLWEQTKQIPWEN